jgi:hypothetical protein
MQGFVGSIHEVLECLALVPSGVADAAGLLIGHALPYPFENRRRLRARAGRKRKEELLASTAGNHVTRPQNRLSVEGEAVQQQVVSLVTVDVAL